MIYVITNQGMLIKSKTHLLILFKTIIPTSESRQIKPGISAIIITVRTSLKTIRNMSQNLSTIVCKID